MRKHRRWLLLLLLPLLPLLAYIVLFRPLLWYNPERPPHGLITSNVIDLAGVFDISKFRSGVGHDYSDGAGETCRSMKHYFGHAHTYDAQHKPTRTQPTATEPNITVYAPFDGVITNYSLEGPPGRDLYVASRVRPQYTVRLFHVDKLPNIRVGSFVKSGQPVATIGPQDGMDVALEAHSLGSPHGVLISIFQVMTDQAFAPYQKLGFQRDDFILGRQYRDAHPLKCSPQGQFAQTGSPAEDIIYLRPDPYEANINRGPQPPIHYGPPQR